MKYHNKKTVFRGDVFDSKKEARRWAQLRALESAGIISGLERQKRYELIPKQTLPTPLRRNGKYQRSERGVYYVADFVYEQNGRTVVEDTKGYQTKEYKLKRKLMLYRYGIQVIET